MNEFDNVSNNIPTIKFSIPHYVKIIDKRCANGWRNHRLPQSATLEDLIAYVEKHSNRVITVFPKGGNVFGYSIEEFYKEYLHAPCTLTDFYVEQKIVRKKTEYSIEIEGGDEYVTELQDSAMIILGMLLYKNKGRHIMVSIKKRFVSFDEDGNRISVSEPAVVYTADTSKINKFGLQ